RRVEALLGVEPARAGEFMEDAVGREMVVRAQARMAAEDAVKRGDNQRRAGEFDAAIASYREAELILQLHPLIGGETLDAQLVRQRLESTLAQRDDARESAESARRLEAERQREQAEAEQRDYRENKLRTLYSEANRAFLNEDYARAESLAQQILLEDPGNEQAEEMRSIAAEARHQKRDEELRATYREEWLRTFDDLDMLAVPQSDVLVFEDLARLAAVKLRKPYEFSAADSTANAERLEIEAALRSSRVPPVSFGADGEGAPLQEVADYFQLVTGLNFVISRAVREELDEEETSVTLEIPAERSVYALLNLITETSESLEWTISQGVVKFVTAEEEVGGQVLQMYEVRDLITPTRDWPGREIDVFPSEGIEYPEEDPRELESLVLTSDEIIELIEENIAADTWGEGSSINATDTGTLVVYTTPDAHAQIASLLDDLRESAGLMVDIQARFLSVEDNFLEDIGVDIRGLGDPGKGTNAFLNDFGDPDVAGDLEFQPGQKNDVGAFYEDGGDFEVLSRVENLYDGEGDGNGFGNTDTLTNTGGLSFQWTYINDLQLELILRAVSKSERVELVTAPRVLIFNTARANLSVLNQVAYVADYDVEIATGSAIADPIIQVVEEGVVLDVRPTVSADRRYITLEMRPTVAELVRPIREFQTSIALLGTVTIQLPELDIQRVRTTVPIPDGGTVLLGGLKIHENEVFESGVPWVNKIPIVRFFFERKGTYTSNRKLLILLRAGIVIPQEHEPSAAVLAAYEGGSR
ncbi:MAG TPA: hypothetical protein VJP77_01245, partial [Planctomycetota bacterium]|nr:hypothetical protein [Planctomycetota bacterium]